MVHARMYNLADFLSLVIAIIESDLLRRQEILSVEFGNSGHQKKSFNYST